MIHTFVLKIGSLRIFLYVCTGKPYIRNVLRTCYVKNRENLYCTRTYYVDDLYPICSKQQCREHACIVWLYYAFIATLKPYLYACTYTIGPGRVMEVIWRIFLLSVSPPLKLHTKYSSRQKNGDVYVPFRPVQTEVKWPFHAQKNGNGTGGRPATESKVNYSNHS